MHKLEMSLVLILAALLLLPGCHLAAHGPHGRADVVAPPAAVKPGPPPHAKAYGHRARHHYHYYPDAYVYFDTGRGLYFYLEDGAWAMSAKLPAHLHVSLGSRVSIELDNDRPYIHYDEHRQKYPGKKKKKKQKGKKGHGDRDD